MGTKGRRNQSFKKFDEPTLLTDVDQIKEMAVKKGLYINDALDIEQLIHVISESNPTASISIQKIPMDNYLSGSLSYNNGTWIMAVNSKHHTKRQDLLWLMSWLIIYCIRKKIQNLKIQHFLGEMIWTPWNIWLMTLLHHY